MPDIDDYSKATPRRFVATKQHWDIFDETPALGDPSVSTTAYNWTDSLNGVKLRGWKRIIKEGGDATTNMIASQQTVEHLDGDHYVKAQQNNGYWRLCREAGYVCNPGGFNPSAPETLSSTSAARDASSKWYSRAYAAQTQLMAGVTVGELKETLNMVRNRGNSMFGLLSPWSTAVKRLRNKKRLIRDLSELWLEFAFGWKPLAADIRGALDAFKKKRLEITRVSASASEKATGDVVNGPNSFGILMYDTQVIPSTECTVRIRGAVRVSVSGHSRNMEAFGVTPQSFVPTVYELIPWSFLVDYFTDLGNVINAIGFPQGDIAWASTSTTRTSTVLATSSGTRFFGDPSFYKNIQLTDSPQVTKLTRKHTARVRGAPPLPTPTVRLPSNPGQWANIVALAIVKFSGRKHLSPSLRI